MSDYALSSPPPIDSGSDNDDDFGDFETVFHKREPGNASPSIASRIDHSTSWSTSDLGFTPGSNIPPSHSPPDFFIEDEPNIPEIPNTPSDDLPKDIFSSSSWESVNQSGKTNNTSVFWDFSAFSTNDSAIESSKGEPATVETETPDNFKEGTEVTDFSSYSYFNNKANVTESSEAKPSSEIEMVSHEFCSSVAAANADGHDSWAAFSRIPPNEAEQFTEFNVKDNTISPVRDLEPADDPVNTISSTLPENTLDNNTVGDDKIVYQNVVSPSPIKEAGDLKSVFSWDSFEKNMSDSPVNMDISNTTEDFEFRESTEQTEYGLGTFVPDNDKSLTTSIDKDNAEFGSTNNIKSEDGNSIKDLDNEMEHSGDIEESGEIISILRKGSADMENRPTDVQGTNSCDVERTSAFNDEFCNLTETTEFPKGLNDVENFAKFTDHASADNTIVNAVQMNSSLQFDRSQILDKTVGEDIRSVDEFSDFAAPQSLNNDDTLKEFVEFSDSSDATEETTGKLGTFSNTTILTDDFEDFAEFSLPKAVPSKISTVSDQENNNDEHTDDLNDFADFSAPEETSNIFNFTAFSDPETVNNEDEDDFAEFSIPEKATFSTVSSLENVNDGQDNGYADFTEFSGPGVNTDNFAAFSNAQDDVDDDFGDFDDFESVKTENRQNYQHSGVNNHPPQSLPYNEALTECYKSNNLATVSINADVLDHSRFYGRQLMQSVTDVDAQFAVHVKWDSSPSYNKMLNTLCLSSGATQNSNSSIKHPTTEHVQDAFDVFGKVEIVSNPGSLLPDDLRNTEQQQPKQKPKEHEHIMSGYQDKSKTKIVISEEAQAIIDSLPNLEFMLSPVLMFPVKG